MQLQPLFQESTQALHWNRPPNSVVWLNSLSNSNLVHIQTDRDGSSFFHALAQAYSQNYILEKHGTMYLDRRQFIQNLRQELTLTLIQTLQDEPNYFQNLIPNQSNLPIQQFQEQLAHGQIIDGVLVPFIADILDKDIYIIDANQKDLEPISLPIDSLYKQRPSIVLLHFPDHYELIGLVTKNNFIQTLFSPDDEFITTLLQRLISFSDNSL